MARSVFGSVRTIFQALNEGARRFVEALHLDRLFGAPVLSKLQHRYPNLDRGQLRTLYEKARQGMEAAQRVLNAGPGRRISRQTLPVQPHQTARIKYRFQVSYLDADGEEGHLTMDVDSDTSIDSAAAEAEARELMAFWLTQGRRGNHYEGLRTGEITSVDLWSVTRSGEP